MKPQTFVIQISQQNNETMFNIRTIQVNEEATRKLTSLRTLLCVTAELIFIVFRLNNWPWYRI